MSTTKLTPHLVAVPDVAETLGVSSFTIRRLIETGALPGVRIGARVMVHNETLERVLREGVPVPRQRRKKASRQVK